MNAASWLKAPFVRRRVERHLQPIADVDQIFERCGAASPKPTLENWCSISIGRVTAVRDEPRSPQLPDWRLTARFASSAKQGARSPTRREPIPRLLDLVTVARFSDGGILAVRAEDGRGMLWYTLDSSDRISALSADWPAERTQYVGRQIWEFFEGSAVHHIYRRIFHSVRSTGVPVSVDVRCDKPDHLVELRILVARSHDRHLSVTIQTLREAPTEYRAIWDLDVVRSGELVRACSWCQSINVRESVWMPFVEAIKEIGMLLANLPPEITHGICGSCLAKFDLEA